MEAPPLPAERTIALDLPSDASVDEVVDVIDKDAVRQLAGESTTRMIPFAEHVRFKADTGEVEFEGVVRLVDRGCGEGAAVLGASRSPDMRPGSRRFDGDDGRWSRRRRPGPPGRGGRATVRRAHRRGVSSQALSAGRRPSGTWSATGWLICRDP